MRYRAYFKAPDGTEASAEFEAHGEVVRICDDHGRIIWDKPQRTVAADAEC